MKVIILGFLGDYFTFDSKFFRSILLLLFKPGFLTNEFNSGKRVKYIPPLRMYIFISILFFFIAGITTNPSDKNSNKETEKKPVAIEDTSSEKSKQGTTFSLQTGDLEINLGEKKLVYTEDKMKKIVTDDSELEQFIDTLGFEKSRFNKFAAKLIITQAMKIKQQTESFTSYFMKNVPIMMFFLLPLFALLLKLFYIRRKKYYVEHLVFSFHLHSFAFIILAVSQFFDNNLIDIIVFLLILAYLFIALRKVYQQSWGKTIFKYVIALGSYFVSLVVCMLATIIFTFLVF